MAGVTVQVIGLERLLRKLDASYLIDPEKEMIVRRGGEYGKGDLGPRLPTGPKNSAASLALQVSEMGAESKAIISVDRNPFIFLERGSAYPQAGRSHSRRPSLSRGQLRIQARHFLSKTKAATGRFVTSLVFSAKGNIERRWSEP